MKPASVVFLLRHAATGSTYAVEFQRDNGKVVRKSQGFVCGNVVALSAYRQVLAAATKQV